MLRPALLHRMFLPACVFALAVLFSASAHSSILLPRADGSTLELEQAASRIVTLSPHLAELVYAAGAGNKLAATVEYSNYPAAASDVPRVGDAFRVDVERIMALRPDLVIAWESGNPAAALAQLQSLGLPVWPVEIREPEQIADTIQLIGLATGHVAEADEQAQTLHLRWAALNQRYTEAPAVTYFYQVDARPLFTINDQHLISMGLETCGGHNIFSDEPGLAFQVAHESVVVADPEVIFAPWLEGQVKPLEAWRSWPAMQAVKNETLYLLNADQISRATPRLFDSLERACKLLHGSHEQRGND